LRRESTASRNLPCAKNGWPDSVYVETSAGRAPNRVVMAVSIGFVVVVWAFNFIAAKIGLRYLPPLTMASFRVTLAGLSMVPAYLICSRWPAFPDEPRARSQGLTWRDLWTFAYLGFFGVVVNQMCFTMGLRYTPVSHAAVIVGMGPIYTLVLAVLFGLERATWHKVVGMAIAFLGVAVLASENGISPRSPSLLGDAITMTGSIGFATYAVLGKRVAGRYDALTMVAFNHFAGAIIILPMAVHQARELGPLSTWREIPWPAWAAVLFMAVCSSALAYLLYFWLLRYLEASQLSAFTYLLPVLAVILGILLLGERGSPMQIAGGILALAGVYWVESGRESPVRN
jgi:drug/metabolite transporter (DMT)-like permease